MGLFSRLFGRKEPEAQPTAAQPAGETTPSWQQGGGVPQELAASEVPELLKSSEPPAVLDVRDTEERERDGWIPGSIHIPLTEIQGRTDELDPQRHLVVYSNTGMRSMEAGTFLLEQGFVDVSNLNGGLQAWAGPVERVAGDE